MTPDDFARASADLSMYRRAGALCAAAPAHLDVDEDWPCNRHLLDAYTSAAASASATRGPAAASAGADGAADCPPGKPTAVVSGSNIGCRFAAFDHHQCRRRDGRPCGPEDCHQEHKAQLRDVTALSAEVDAIPLVSWLLNRRDEWEDA